MEKERLENEGFEQEHSEEKRHKNQRRPASLSITEQRPGNKTGQEDDSPMAALAIKQQSEHEKVQKSLLAEQKILSLLRSSSSSNDVPPDSQEARLKALIDAERQERAAAINLALKLEEENQALSAAQLQARPRTETTVKRKESFDREVRACESRLRASSINRSNTLLLLALLLAWAPSSAISVRKGPGGEAGYRG